jgi:hypothetical protein
MARTLRTDHGVPDAHRAAELGIFAGMLGALVMGVLVILASGVWQGIGFWTPLYLMVAPLDAGVAEASVQAAAVGDAWYFDHQPFVVGGAVHLFIGAAVGAVFGTLVWRVPTLQRRPLLTGAAYGLGVFVVMSGLIAVFDTSLRLFPIRYGVIDWVALLIANLGNGLVLGLWIRLRPWDLGVPVLPAPRTGTRQRDVRSQP